MRTLLVILLAGCSGGNRTDPMTDLSVLPDLTSSLSLADLAGADLTGGGGGGVKVNELFADGPDELTDPDWAELINVGAATADVSGWKVRDNDVADLFTLPAGTTIPPGGYLLIYCDDAPPDGGVAGGIHVPWKLGLNNGDEFHVINAQGTEVDMTAFAAGAVPATKGWGRLPNGTGAFAVTTPTKGTSNTP